MCAPHNDPRFWRPRSAYVHVPFCRHRCGYCSFTLLAGRSDLIPDYLRALERELTWLETPSPVDTIYIGGGTPTHLEPTTLRELLDLVSGWFPLADGYEFSVEANPLDVTSSRLDALKESGVTRLSLGAQSFADRKLKLLERDHRQGDIEQAWHTARPVIPVLSLDLIFGAPGETLAEWRNDLLSALDLAPDHISLYGLTWERGTSFWGRQLRGELTPCSDSDEREMYELGIEMLEAAGFEHYEVSNFARPGFRCRHNEAYWTGRTYYGAGPGAARFVAGRRELNHRSTTTYLRRVLAGRSPVGESEQLSPENAARERLVFGLRRLEGVERGTFLAETGCDLKELAGKAVDDFVDSGWLVWRGSQLRLTRDGAPDQRLLVAGVARNFEDVSRCGCSFGVRHSALGVRHFVPTLSVCPSRRTF